MLALLVVALMPALDGVEQIRILPIARTGGRHHLIRPLFVCAMLREHDHRAIIARVLENVLDGHRIGHAAVEVQMAVDLDRLRHKRKRRGCAHDVDVEHGVFDLQVRRRPEDDVGRDRHERHRVLQVGLVVERIETVLHVVQHEVVADEAAAAREGLGAHIALIIAKCEVDAVGTTDLVGLVAQSVQDARAHAIAGIGLDVVLHQHVEDARRELPAEAAAFEDDRRLARVCRPLIHSARPFSTYAAVRFPSSTHKPGTQRVSDQPAHASAPRAPHA